MSTNFKRVPRGIVSLSPVIVPNIEFPVLYATCSDGTAWQGIASTRGVYDWEIIAPIPTLYEAEEFDPIAYVRSLEGKWVCRWYEETGTAHKGILEWGDDEAFQINDRPYFIHLSNPVNLYIDTKSCPHYCKGKAEPVLDQEGKDAFQRICLYCDKPIVTAHDTSEVEDGE